jgi:hypothetical protein
MGVFPLADTLSFFSNPPRSGGDSRAPVKDRTDEVWWHEPTTNPLRNVVPTHSPIHYIDYSQRQHPASRRGPVAPGAGRYIRRSRIARTPHWTYGPATKTLPAGRHLPHAGPFRPDGMHAALEPSCRSSSPRVRSRWHPNAVEQ